VQDIRANNYLIPSLVKVDVNDWHRRIVSF